MDRKIFVISDTHFGHANILKFTDDQGKTFRSFSDVTEMDEYMVRKWNSVVRPQDIVYHLGDVYFGSGERANEILKRLVGRKRLILGNHDNGKDQLLNRCFEKILMWRMFPEYGVLLTHVPVHPDSLRELKNVHGHIHQRKLDDNRYINVSVEQTDYTPVSIENIARV